MDEKEITFDYEERRAIWYLINFAVAKLRHDGIIEPTTEAKANKIATKLEVFAVKELPEDGSAILAREHEQKRIVEILKSNKKIRRDEKLLNKLLEEIHSSQ